MNAERGAPSAQRDGAASRQTVLETALNHVRQDAPPGVHPAVAWDPTVFPGGESDPRFDAAECFVLVSDGSQATIPTFDGDELLCWLADRLQDAVVDRERRPWPEVDGVVLDATVVPGLGAVWSDRAGEIHIPIGELSGRG